MTRAVIVDFNALPRATRERLVNSTGPKPTLAPAFAARNSCGGSAWLWLWLGIFCSLILYVMVKSGFGQLAHDPVQPAGLIILYSGTLFLAIASGIVLVFQRKWRGVLPFHPGRYLLPLDFVDARSRQLRIISLGDLAGFKAVHHLANGVYTHSSISLRFHNNGSEEFRVHSRAQAEAQIQRLQRQRAIIVRAVDQQDENTLREQDPFFEVRTQPGGFESLRDKALDDSEGGPLSRELPRRLRKPFLLGLALAVSMVLGPGLWLVRNLLSDDAAFALAKADLSGKALSTYATKGWRHVDEARELSRQRGFQNCEKQDTEE